MSWCQPNEIRFEALTVEFLSALSQFGLKAFAMINVLDTLEKNEVWVAFGFFFPILHVNIYPFLVAPKWLHGLPGTLLA